MLRALSIACCLALSSSFLAAGPLRSQCPSSSTAVRSHPAPCMKKGRSQGGGPKISLKNKKLRKTEADHAADKRAAQLVRVAKNAKRKPPVGEGRQQDRFVEQCNDGSVKHPVFARVAGDLEWLHVGHVSIAMESELTAAQAAKLQKRLILDHAPRVHPLALQPNSDILECGLGAPGAEEEGADTLLQPHLLDVMDSGPLPPMQALKLAAECGFKGSPLPSGHYFGEAGADAMGTDETKVQLGKLGNDAKSKILVQQMKTLGMRSLG